MTSTRCGQRCRRCGRAVVVAVEFGPGGDGQGAEIGVVGDDEAPFGHGPRQEQSIGAAAQLGFDHIDDGEPCRMQERYDIGVDVLVGEKREVAELHATPAVR